MERREKLNKKTIHDRGFCHEIEETAGSYCVKMNLWPCPASYSVDHINENGSKMKIKPAVCIFLGAMFTAASPVLADTASSSTHTASATKLEQITPIGDIKRGSMVTVHGTVERILDTDEFRIADDSGDIRVYIGYRNFVPVTEGERVHVTGFVDRDLFKEIYAREIIHADGRVSRLSQGYE